MCSYSFDSRDGTTEGHTAAIISATMNKYAALNSIPLKPSVHITNQGSVNPISNDEEIVQGDEFQYEDVELDTDSLKDQLGIREILESLSTLSRKVSGQQETRLSVPESGTSARLPDSGFDPMATILAEGSPAAQSNCSQTLESSETLLPSIFEETESFGLKVVDIIAERINDLCSKKPLDTKLKELQDKYKTPENCKVLCVPKVNLELWHDLPRATKTRDLGLQEVQKNIIKSAQPMLLLFDTVVKAKAEKKAIQPMEILPMLADAVTLIGHASYLASLKRREFLKPDISSAYQSVCSKSNPVTTFLFGDELPKHIKDIGEVNKISRKTLARVSTTRHYVPEYKSNYNHQFGRHGRRGPFLESRGYSRQQYQDRKGNNAATSVKTFKVQTDKT